MPDYVKEKLKEARDAVEKAELSAEDEEDVLDNMVKLTAELEKPEVEPSRVERFLNRIQDVSSTVGGIISSAASIAKMLGD